MLSVTAVRSYALACVPVLDGFGRGGGSQLGHEDPDYVEEEHKIDLSEEIAYEHVFLNV